MTNERGGWLVVVVVVVVVVECARPEQPGARVLSQPTRGVFVVVVLVLVVVAQANRSEICCQTTTGVVLSFSAMCCYRKWWPHKYDPDVPTDHSPEL